MSKSQSGATDNGTSSVVEYLSLAIQAASRLKVKTIPLSIVQAQQLLTEIDTLRLGELATPLPRDPPPPLEVTSVTYEEERARTHTLSYVKDRPGYVGMFKKARSA